MAFFKKVYKKISGKWYPQSVTVGKPMTTDQVADRLAAISTVSRGDTYAVLKDLGGVLGDYMAQGRTVKLEGIGTFYYTANAAGKGSDSEADVKASHINSVHVRFIPETTRSSSNQVTTRSLVGTNIFWQEWLGKENTEGEPENPFEDPQDLKGSGDGEAAAPTT